MEKPMTPSGPRRRIIMLVDDDMLLGDLYRARFEHEGFIMLVYRSAEQALRALKEGTHPDLLLLDLIMPVMDGFSFLGEAKRRGVTLPIVVILTNQEGESDKARAFALGANHYIIKANATPQEMCAQVEHILDMHEAIPNAS